MEIKDIATMLEERKKAFDEFVKTNGSWRFRRRTQIKCLDKLL